MSRLPKFDGGEQMRWDGNTSGQARNTFVDRLNYFDDTGSAAWCCY